jgi:Ni,Fe-hydrogenase I small subunit
MAKKSSRLSERPPDVKEVHIVWLTAGLGCDGDTVSITAAEQPSIEDVLLGAIPGLPKVHLHNPVLAPQVGGEFMEFFYQAERGEIDPFVFVVEGSIPNERIKEAGYWAAESVGSRRRRNLCNIWRNSCDGWKCDRLHGAGRLSWLGFPLAGRDPHR